jgi:HAD superfamily hydrolase (TIGR01509 family)
VRQAGELKAAGMPEGGALPRAVVLDVDGTLVDSERDGHRVAFNAAFEQLELPWRWDEEEYGRLLAVTGGKRRLDAYLADQGVPEGKRADLVARLHERKTEVFQQLVADGRIQPRPGVVRLVDELEAAGIRLGVATTGTRAWVDPLLDRIFGPFRFEVVVGKDDVHETKPDPAAHRLALDVMGVAPADALAVEDSPPGLAAARSAGIPCVVVTNDYTRHADFDGAELVLDGFGEPDAPAAVLADPHGLAPPGRLDAATLRRLAGRLAAGD